jgi:hypothetical protein
MESKNSKLILVSLTIPPEVCGISDYAYQAAEALYDKYDSVEVAVDRMPATLPVLSGKVKVGNWRTILKNADGPTDVMLNYAPRAYSKYALPIKLILELRKFKKLNKDNRLFILFHETWNGSKDLKFHHKVFDAFAKWSSVQFVKLASGVAVITDLQEKEFRSKIEIDEIRTLTVGANIYPAHESAGLESSREKGNWVIFGLPNTRLGVLKTHSNLIKLLIKQGLISAIKTIGPSTGSIAEEELAFANATFGEKVLTQMGALSTDEVSRQLLRADGALVGQTADSLRKSGSFAAFAAHAVPVICEAPATLSSPPGVALFRPEELQNDPQLFEREKEMRSKMLHQWYWSTRSWAAISSDLLSWMKR